MFIAQTLSETWFDDEAQPHRTQVTHVKLPDTSRWDSVVSGWCVVRKKGSVST